MILEQENQSEELIRRPPERTVRSDGGPKIVAIGGGNGLSNMLRGLKLYTKNLTAVVTVADDGGGSGMLRNDLGMPPPGDIRNCMQALANVEPLMEQLLGYRFTEGSLAGQAFGNLLLAALNGISDSFDQAVSRMREVLAITGQVLPVTDADVQLEATFENGASVVGESRISRFKKEQDCRIRRVRLIPEHPPALPEALRAIGEAEMILLGPGSLYTSIIPNLLVDGIVPAICASRALKLYICNIMTQEGETEGYTAGDHVNALLSHGSEGIVDLCLVNSEALPHDLMQRYRAEDASPVKLDKSRVEAMGVELAARSLVSSGSGFARHSPDKLAIAVMELYRERAQTKVY